MKIKQSLLFGFFLVILPWVSQAVTAPVPAPPSVKAKSYILVDSHSGRVLAQKNMDEKVEPASITKLMTAYVVYKEIAAGRLSESDLVTISKKAWRMKGSKMFVEVGKKVPVHELLKGLIIQSGNDATVALAEHVAGTESAFADYMNQYAKALGMTNTHFENSTGWPHANHYTTARDIATLAKAIITEFPEHYKMYKDKVFTYNGIKQYNRNKLLWRDDNIDGVKTGHTESAGYCLVSSGKRDDMRLIAVVFGTASEKARADVSQALLNYGFRFYETNKLYTAGETLKQNRIWMGQQETVNLGLDNDLYVTIPRGQYKHLDAVMETTPEITAPVNKGDKLGNVKVRLGDQELVTRPLVVLQAVAEGNLWQKTRDRVLGLFN